MPEDIKPTLADTKAADAKAAEVKATAKATAEASAVAAKEAEANKDLKPHELRPSWVLRQFGMYYPGNVAGFDEAATNRLRASGHLAPWYEGQAYPGDIATRLDAVEKEHRLTPEEATLAAIDIPADWEQRHHLEKISLAEKIHGTRPASKVDAEEIIRMELDRRAAMAQTNPTIAKAPTQTPSPTPAPIRSR
jgi:hypothetical protein